MGEGGFSPTSNSHSEELMRKYLQSAKHKEKDIFVPQMPAMTQKYWREIAVPPYPFHSCLSGEGRDHLSGRMANGPQICSSAPSYSCLSSWSPHVSHIPGPACTAMG